MDKNRNGALLTPTYKKWAAKFGGLPKVNFTNTEFENIFTVYTADQKQSKTLLNPKVQKKIIKLKKESDLDFHFSLLDGQLFIAIPIHRNLFDPPISSPVSYDSIFKDFKLIETMFNIIEILDIDLPEQEKISITDLYEIMKENGFK